MAPTRENMAHWTPMIRQYYALKSQEPDAIIMFRMGDFYEIFGEDAEKIAPQLNLVLTSRERGDQKRIPFCGMPHHAAKSYWLRLLKLGYKIAIAEQTQDPKEAKGLVERKIVRTITPGTIDDLDGLEDDQPNYIASIYEHPKTRIWSMALADVSTGELKAGVFKDKQELIKAIYFFHPRELLVREFIRPEFEKNLTNNPEYTDILLTNLPESLLHDHIQQEQFICEIFAIPNTDEILTNLQKPALPALTSLLFYLKSLRVDLSVFRHVKDLYLADTMALDPIACRDLEIFETVRRRSRKGSLFATINLTLSAMGARLLREFLCQPLINISKIAQRQKHAHEFVDLGYNAIEELRKILCHLPDLDRLTARVVSYKVTPHELKKIQTVLNSCIEIAEFLKKHSINDEFLQWVQIFDSVEPARQLLNEALLDTVVELGTGAGIFKKGHDPLLDRLNELSQNSALELTRYEEKLKQETGIQSLKIKSHKTFGLLIEVTKANLSRVPDHFIRRQTMVNTERFVTDELLELNEQINAAQEKAIEEEHKLYQKLLSQLQPYCATFKEASRALAYIDVLQSFACLAIKHRYCLPRTSTNQQRRLCLKGARHPVIEALLGSHNFTPNSLEVPTASSQLLITGPNMGGKSTFMRQTALCAILHQIGCFVPALEAELPVFDHIFTRVGASDDLAQGQSTFWVEMSETAHILRHATSHSLIILDEVGRGTSSEDGLAIAAAILKFLAEKLKATVLFATHYHELVEFASTLPSVQCLQTEVQKTAEGILFTHRVIPGSCESSFGVEVAKRAGLPSEVICQANRYLKTGLTSRAKSRKRRPQPQELTQPLFDESTEFFAPAPALTTHNRLKDISEKLANLCIESTTPIEALTILNDLKKLNTVAQDTPKDVLTTS